MKKKRKKRNKKIRLRPLGIILLIISILMIFFGIGCVILDRVFYFTLIGDDTVEIDVNKEYLESGAVAKFLGKNIDDIKIKSNVNSKKLGTYQVSYSCRYLIFNKKLERKVVVKDLEKPSIELQGDKSMFLSLGEEYKEPGYKAIDNVDGDITKRVVVENKINSNKVGQYKIKYTVKDSSKNTFSIERDVEVLDSQTILQASLADFKLDGIFPDVQLSYNKDKVYNYFDDVTFVGDSNVAYLYQYGKYVPGDRVWGRLNLNIAQINSSTFTTFGNGSSSTLENALKTYKPKYLIASVGINTALYMNKDKFLNESQILIDNIKKNYPNTKLIFSAVFPVYSGTLNAGLQNTINQYNYYLLELCHKNKINFINFSDRVKDGSGLASHDYYECNSSSNCGFHLNSAGKAYYIDYIKHLDLGRN